MRVRRGAKSAHVFSMHLHTINLVWTCFFIWFSSRCLRFCACSLSMVDFTTWNLSPPPCHHDMVCLEVVEPQNLQWLQGPFQIRPALLFLWLHYRKQGIAFFALYLLFFEHATGARHFLLSMLFHMVLYDSVMLISAFSL